MKHIEPSRPPSPLGDFEQLVLLALVRLGDDAYGATIRREIETRTGRDLAISAVYVALDRLERKGLVRSRIGEPSPTRGGRRRKHVALLPEGRRALAAAYQQFMGMAEGLEEEFGRR
ncbi:MAG: PadR family transcriptional regulator [Vicinamibacterales bacterium]